ncbi:hypothetical protein AAP_03317 [Ascosphaera apis ARSEF 7405]|uniref:Uncharacterized protein n=1 Tax=Ascosphaera apis ARSEF 7405 TaxID=392613 RepID=A0A167YPW9_9EURO|nr:hypothetical protein AAP_03317 [Ascosphaera apis ARSEF 7405]
MSFLTEFCQIGTPNSPVDMAEYDEEVLDEEVDSTPPYEEGFDSDLDEDAQPSVGEHVVPDTQQQPKKTKLHGDGTKLTVDEKVQFCQFAIAHAEEFRTIPRASFYAKIRDFTVKEFGKSVSRPGEILYRLTESARKREAYLAGATGVAVPDSDLLQAATVWRSIVLDHKAVMQAKRKEELEREKKDKERLAQIREDMVTCVSQRKRLAEEEGDQTAKRHAIDLTRLSETMLRAEELKVQRQQIELDCARVERAEGNRLEDRVSAFEKRIDEKFEVIQTVLEKTLSAVEGLKAKKPAQRATKSTDLMGTQSQGSQFVRRTLPLPVVPNHLNPFPPTYPPPHITYGQTRKDESRFGL